MAQSAGSEHIRVTLGECESDVLRLLVIDHPSGLRRHKIVVWAMHRGVSKEDAERGVSGALRLLHEMRFVQSIGNDLDEITWYATREGVERAAMPDHALLSQGGTRMSVMIELSCSGCFDATVRVGPLRKRFHGTHGDWGFGSASVDSIEDLTPEGWVMFDPWTYCTYCPTCWESLQREAEKEPAHA